MAASDAEIEFLEDWRHVQRGSIERGGRLKINYDQRRLDRCFTTWRGVEVGELVTNVRFHPRGEIVSGSMVSPLRNRENHSGAVVGHGSVPFELRVPSDATKVEIWFRNSAQTSSRCDAWDSQFGANYWFDVGGTVPRIPAQPVSYRNGAVTSPNIVNVLEQSVAKVNVFPRSGEGTDLQTVLNVVAWVSETKAGANAWIDVHVFDPSDALIRAETLTMRYGGLASQFFYEFSGSVYQGSTATPGSVQPRPDARRVQYRLYYAVNYGGRTASCINTTLKKMRRFVEGCGPSRLPSPSFRTPRSAAPQSPDRPRSSRLPQRRVPRSPF